jgi:hypothetical protein
MKVPLVYPKIPDTKDCPLKQCIVFEKLDGTNLHWRWNERNGFYAFGTRRDEFDLNDLGEKEFKEAHPGLEDVVSAFVNDDMSKELDKFLRTWYDQEEEVIIFTEYYGRQSFAGQHQKNDKVEHYLIDVQDNGGILSPQGFLNMYQKKFEWCMPRVLYKGKYSGELVEKIRKGKFRFVDEGAVIKGVSKGKVYMAKVKTDLYLEKLKAQFKDNWQDYWE